MTVFCIEKMQHYYQNDVVNISLDRRNEKIDASKLLL